MKVVLRLGAFGKMARARLTGGRYSTSGTYIPTFVLGINTYVSYNNVIPHVIILDEAHKVHHEGVSPTTHFYHLPT